MNLDPKIVLDWSYSNRHIRTAHIKEVMKANNFQMLGAGKSRMVFLSPNKRFVLKFGKSLYGHGCNEVEESAWRRYKKTKVIGDSFYLAPCRMYKGCALMMWAMVKIYGVTFGCEDGRLILGQDEDDALNLHVQIDSNQIGLMRNGRLAAYDYADEF